MLTETPHTPQKKYKEENKRKDENKNERKTKDLRKEKYFYLYEGVLYIECAWAV